METDWKDAIDFVLEMEGGEQAENNPADPGGLTKFGISQKAYPNMDIANLTREEAEGLYRHDYWTPCKCDELPRPYAIALFDSAVNQGVKVATRIMQIALEVEVDGVIGPETIAAAHAAKPRRIRIMLAERLAAYARLMAEKPNLLVFARNWSHRVLSLARRIEA